MENMHELMAGMVPPLKPTAPFVAVLLVMMVPAPHVPVSPSGLCTKRFVGKVSLKVTPVIALPDGLVMVKVNIEVCPMERLDGLNDFEMVGCASSAPDVTSNVKKAATGAASQRTPPRNEFTIIFCLLRPRPMPSHLKGWRF